MAIGAITALFNPWIGSRILSDTLSKHIGGGGGSIAKGIFGAGGAIGFGEFYIAITTVKKLFNELSDALRKQLDFAHRLYGKSLIWRNVAIIYGKSSNDSRSTWE